MGGISDEELLEKDLYEILGVSQSSTEDEIRNAYKKKARRLHPDKNSTSDAHDNFILLTAAKDALLHPIFRERYDLHRIQTEFTQNEKQFRPRTEDEIRMANLQMEVERLQDELDQKTVQFEEKFRRQQYQLTDNELKLIKLEEENRKMIQKLTMLENMNQQLCESHKFHKEKADILQTENTDLKAKLSWLMTGNEDISPEVTGCPAADRKPIDDEQQNNTIFMASLACAFSNMVIARETRILSRSNSGASAIALWDFHGNAPDELSFQAGNEITNVQRVDDEWLKGEFAAQKGIFPASFVELIN